MGQHGRQHPAASCEKWQDLTFNGLSARDYARDVAFKHSLSNLRRSQQTLWRSSSAASQTSYGITLTRKGIDGKGMLASTRWSDQSLMTPINLEQHILSPMSYDAINPDRSSF